MTISKSQDLVSGASVENFSQYDVSWPLNRPDQTYFATEEEEFRDDDDEQDQLIYERVRGSTSGPREGARNGKGPTFADVITSRLGLSRMQSIMSNSGTHLAGGQWPEGSAAPTAHKSKRSASIVQSLVLALLFLVLIVGFVLVISQLYSLVEDEKVKLGLSRGDNLRQMKKKLFKEIDSKLDDAHRKQLEAERKSRWLVSSTKCHIPKLDPWDSTIQDYVARKPAMNCSSVVDDFFREADKSLSSRINTTTKSFSFSTHNRLFFTPEAVKLGALTGRCCYRLLTRSINNDDDLETAETCTPILMNGLPMNRSLIEVSCGAPLNYGNVHTFMMQNSDEEAAYKKVADKQLNKTDYFNVLMVGVDTMSRLNALRQLNETLGLLASDLYGALDFVGYNKVGENTFPNLIPLLTGMRPSQLSETQCWMVKNYSDESERGDDYLDNCKYLWNYYQQVGYTTYLSEDWPQASTFNYLKPGFKSEPTTYYGRPFTLARQKFTIPQFESLACTSCQLDRPVVELDLENLHSFLEQHHSTPYFAFHWINCPQHDDLNGASQVDKILRDFFHKVHQLTRDRTFVIFFSDHGYRWNNFVSTRIGHYESSLPLLAIAPPESFIRHYPQLHERLKEHRHALLTPFDIFKTMIEIRELSRSSLSTRAEAAPKVASKRQAAIPMVPGFANSIISHPFPSTTDTNSAASGSHTFGRGANATMPPGGISTGTSFNQYRILDGTSYQQNFESLSLLQHHSSEQLDRSCIDAGIPDNYCVCQQFEPIQADRLDALGAAYYLVYGHLESRLRNHLTLCRQLELEKIHQAELFDFSRISSARRVSRRSPARQSGGGDAEVRVSTEKPVLVIKSQREESRRSDYLPSREYSIMFSTKPGSGLFQEVVRYYGTNMSECEAAVAKARGVVDMDSSTDFGARSSAVAAMNSVCQFSVHSESISRFNLYKDQSKCVQSNIELKKICYCNDLK